MTPPRSLILRTTAAAACSALLLAGCGAASSEDGRTKVVASFYPFAWVAEQVGGDLVSVENLTQPGGEPHDLELSPRQVADVGEADVLVFQSGFQAAVDDAVEQSGREKDGTVDVADEVTEIASDEHGDHEHEEGHDEEGHDEEGHDHDHGELDPHTWLDPQNMVATTEAVSAALAEADPDHAEQYRGNAERLVAELTDLDDELTAGLKTCESRTIVTTHAAFGYLADRYDLEQEPISGIDPSDEPKPSQLADITRLVRSEGISTIFTEQLVSPAIARTIADETGATTAVLDPIEGLSDETTDQTYLTLMRRNLEAISEANSCR